MASDRHDDAPDPHPEGQSLRLADLAQRRDHRFLRQPDAAALAALARALDLRDLRKVRFEGTLTPVGKHDWDLTAQLGATVVQPCVATLVPVTTRIEERVVRKFRAELPELDDATEIEMPEDDTLDPLPEVIDFDAILTEALSLALPQYPRADDAEPVAAQFTRPGERPLDDDAVRPFAGLAALRSRLEPAPTADGTEHDTTPADQRNDARPDSVASPEGNSGSTD